jgi:adenine-specific DNA methylase
MKSFIEVQFPVSKLSKESYKERKGAQGQTLTQLGKWWGGKPLVLVRAAILGLLIPASDDPKRDREIFFKLMGMDEEGLLRRKTESIPKDVVYKHLTPSEQSQWFELSSGGKHELRRLSREERDTLQRTVFLRLTYDKKIEFCCRPEECDILTPEDWVVINSHLGTNASSLSTLVQELGKRQFGENPRIGDAFCGRGSVPFEAARLGCDVVGTDLSPVATLLTWAALNIIGGGEKVVTDCRSFLQNVYDEVDKQVIDWGIEHNSKGWRGYSYLYCNEVVCPECDWKIPLLPSLVIAERMDKVIAELVPVFPEKRFEIHIRHGCTTTDINHAKESGTINDSQIRCPNLACAAHVAPLSLASIRHEGSGGLRLWEESDIIPQRNDIFQERLYCIRWKETTPEGVKWHFCTPTCEDIQNEERALNLLTERFISWQEKGCIPSTSIETGEKTGELIRTRGWTYWHHLFTPRQLLYHGLLSEIGSRVASNNYENIIMALALGRCTDWNSKLCLWDSGTDKSKNTFYNQALNPLYVYSARGFSFLKPTWNLNIEGEIIKSKSFVGPIDARSLSTNCDIWITDPPYADAINYHELSEFFLAWYRQILPRIFNQWIPDSRRALAIRGSDEDFRKGMMESYHNLTDHMPNDGIQIVMFTHQEPAVWADLTLILWAAGLSVTSAWCIQTETESGVKKGNYVKGTNLLILHKQTSEKVVFLDEVYPEIEDEVKKQLSSMTAIDDKDDPNFSDTDYQLAAYAASLRVLTSYKQIEGIDVARELAKTRINGEVSELEKVIQAAVKIACDFLIPTGIDSSLWKQLLAEERFYLKGLELESHGEFRVGVFQELARGFGIRQYRQFLFSSKANETRLKTATEFKSGDLGGEGFGGTVLRKVLFAIRQTSQTESTNTGRTYLRSELAGLYWERRKDIIELLKYLSLLENAAPTSHWKQDAHNAFLLASAIEQDHI